MAFGVNREHLLNVEGNSMCVELAVLIVNLDVALCNLVGQEDILSEN